MRAAASEVRPSRPDNQQVVETRRAYTIAQFLALYGLGRTRLYEELDTGRLASYSVGRRRFISAAAAEAWQEKLEAEAASPKCQALVAEA